MDSFIHSHTPPPPLPPPPPPPLLSSWRYWEPLVLPPCDQQLCGLIDAALRVFQQAGNQHHVRSIHINCTLRVFYNGEVMRVFYYCGFVKFEHVRLLGYFTPLTYFINREWGASFQVMLVPGGHVYRGPEICTPPSDLCIDSSNQFISL